MGMAVMKAHLTGARFPLNVMLSVTDRCPSRCNYCQIPARRKKELTLEEITGLIDQVCLMGCRRLGIWGGEPFVREDLGEIIAYASRKDLFVTLDSNGYLVPERLSWVKQLDHLILALDGDKDAHDANREAGSFERVLAAVRAASGKVPLWTITVLTKNNLESIDFILGTARKYNFLATFQLLHHNDSLGRNHDALKASAAEYRKAIRKLIEAKKKGAPIASSLRYLEYLERWKDYDSPRSTVRLSPLKCWAGALYCNVDTDGSVYPCSLLVDRFPAMNFLDHGFERSFAALAQNPCKNCLASCFTEYNYLYSLDPGTVVSWIRAMKRTKSSLCRARS